jgi:hypothetical protein
MGEHESKDEGPASPAEAATSLPEPMPKMALAPIDPIPPTGAAAACDPIPPAQSPAIEAASIDPPKIDLADTPPIVPASSDPAPQAQAETAADDPSPPPITESAAFRLNRFTVLAAALALAAGLGGMIGALATTALSPAAPPALALGAIDLEAMQTLKENIVQARVELAALKASVDAGNRNAATQLTKISERVDRVERSQGEPAARFSKAVDTLERVSRELSGQAKEVTGSVTPPQQVGAASPSGKLEGWTVRGVHHGIALLEGRMGFIAVDEGDVVPGIGRVEAIRKQDGRWVVVTPKGLITSAR